MVDNPQEVVDIAGVTVAYGSSVVLDDIWARLDQGDSLALIGPNGAGKTTLIKALVGLAPIVSGSLRVVGRTPEEARSSIAYVPQADVLDSTFPVSALDVVLMGRYRKVGWLRRPKALDRAIAANALEEVGLGARAGDRFGVLSGGQRQRVLLARAIAQEATLLLLDEPFNGVDTATIDVVLGVLQRLRENGAAVVMSTHDLAVARAASSSAMLLNRKAFACGRIDEVVSVENLRKTYGERAVIMGEHSDGHTP